VIFSRYFRHYTVLKKSDKNVKIVTVIISIILFEKNSYDIVNYIIIYFILFINPFKFKLYLLL